MRSRLLLFTFSVIATLAFGNAEFSVAAEHCDIPGPPIATQTLPTADACEQACAKHSECTRWVYVSGWKRCSLKKVDHKPRPLKIWAARVGESIQSEHDNSGKDFKKISHVESAEQCLKHCSEVTGCLGVAYLDGYKDCYLKNTAGKISPKVFSCGLRKASASE